MDEFHELLKTVCKRPGMYVEQWNFDRVALFLKGCDLAWDHLKPGEKNTGFNGFRQWVAVRLDSCVRTDWSAIIANEDVGPDKIAALVQLYGEFVKDRQSRGLDSIRADFERLSNAVWAVERKRTCFCERRIDPELQEADPED
jgi:hypothetical protein